MRETFVKETYSKRAIGPKRGSLLPTEGGLTCRYYCGNVSSCNVLFGYSSFRSVSL